MAIKADGTPETPVAFDAAAFKTELMAEFNNAINGTVNSMKKDMAKLIEGLKPVAPPDPAPAPAPPAGDPPKPDGAPAQTLAELELRFQNLNKKFEAQVQETTEAKKLQAQELEKRLEVERVNGFQKIIADLPFANTKAREQFSDALINKVKRDDDGSLFVETPKGPLRAEMFIQEEFDASPHLQQRVGFGGAGAAPSAKVDMSKLIPDIANMSASDILKLTPEQRDAAMSYNYDVASPHR